MVKLIFFDLDETLWSIAGGGHASLLTLPYRKINRYQIEDAAGKVLRLRKEVFDVFTECRAMGVCISVLSANDEGKVLPVLDLFGLSSFISFPRISWEDRERGTCDKARQLREALELFREKRGLRFKMDEILFVDDRLSNIEQLAGTGVICHHFNKEEGDLLEVMEVIERCGKS